jgi:small subunit ribosomal protein S6
LAENVYEGMFLLDSNRYSRDPAGVSGQISEVIQQHGGQMLASRLWDERRLAYPVNGHRKGTYWLTYFRLDGRQLTTVTRQCQLNDNILRTLFVKVDPRIVDALVAHANSSTGPSVPIERRTVKEEAEEGVEQGVATEET